MADAPRHKSLLYWPLRFSIFGLATGIGLFAAVHFAIDGVYWLLVVLNIPGEAMVELCGGEAYYHSGEIVDHILLALCNALVWGLIGLAITPLIRAMKRPRRGG